MLIVVSDIQSSPSYEGVDWNITLTVKVALDDRSPSYEGVDWNCSTASVEPPILFSLVWGSGLKFRFGCALSIIVLFSLVWGSGLKSIAVPAATVSELFSLVWGSGLKFFPLLRCYCCVRVLPRMREWIEIFSRTSISGGMPVLPRMREWIEISLRHCIILSITVLPRMREWIEIAFSSRFCFR